MTVPVEQAAINLASAVVLGSVIGFERQWRNRLAGLRTNTLVALGAANFVVFEAPVPDTSSPTRVAAQVVSGIGFLGAGVIFREGLAFAASIPRRPCGVPPPSAFWQVQVMWGMLR